VEIEIDHSNYDALKLDVRVDDSAIVSCSPAWDTQSFMTYPFYSVNALQLSIEALREGETKIDLILEDRFGNKKVNSFKVSVGKSVVISADPSEGDAPLLVKFEAVTAKEFGRVVETVWDFGDGNIDTHSGVSVEHNFSEAGNYEVKVRVVDEEGRKAEDDRYIVVKNPNFVYHLHAGRNDLSLPTRMHLDEDGLQAIFGSEKIDMLVKQAGFGWAYWDRDRKPKPERQMSRFNTLDSTEGFILYAKEDLDITLPVKENESGGEDDFARLYGPGWYLVGVNADKSVEEIKEMVEREGKTLEIIEYFEDEKRMHFYTPDPELDAKTSPAIPRLDRIEREWGFFIKIK
jgi:PKD repeat protein